MGTVWARQRLWPVRPSVVAGRVAILLLTVLAGLAPAAPAQAHAALLGSTPAAGAVLAAAPGEVILQFSEPVTLVAGRIQVVAPDGERIGGTPSVRDGSALHIPIRAAARPLGTYLVSYRVISADSHPVAGALTYSLGAPSARPAEPTDDVHPSVQVAVSTTHVVGYVGLLLIVGPSLLLTLLWPRRMPRAPATRTVQVGLILIAVSALTAVWVQVPYVSGGAIADVSPAALAQVLTSWFGAVLTARLVLLAALAAVLMPVLRSGRRGVARRRLALVLALGVATLATWPLAGHASTAPLAPMAVVADVVHLGAMAVWLGGLVTLVVFLLPRAHPRALGVILPAWSRWAALAVLWLVIGGAGQAVLQIDSWTLWRSDYGRLLLAKLALLMVVLTAAAYARRLVRRAGTPRPAPGAPELPQPPADQPPADQPPADQPPADQPPPGARLRRTVAIEAVSAALVLAVSAVLVQVPPARGQSTAAAQAAGGVSDTLTCALYTLQFNIYPVRIGEYNTVHAYVYTPQGRALPAQQWSVSVAAPGLEAVRTPMLDVRPHHAVGSVTFPLPGTYSIAFTVRTTDIDQATVRTTVTVR